ncbi:MAG: hypothetical protein RPT25_13735 [Cycloclasticus sp.]|jgi:hypothetical protein
MIFTIKKISVLLIVLMLGACGSESTDTADEPLSGDVVKTTSQFGESEFGVSEFAK